MKLSPEQFASLRRVLANPAAKASTLVALPAEQIENLLEKLENIVRCYAEGFGDGWLLFRHVSGQSGGLELNGKVIRELICAQSPVVAVGDDGTMLVSAGGIISLSATASESEQGPCICVLCSARQLYVFAAGRLLAEIGTEPLPIQGTSNWQHSWRELHNGLDDHFHNCIENEKSVRYWENRKDRILLAGPDGTEKIFHLSLFWWCNNFIKDALDVYGEAQAMGQDKTDITIVTEAGNIVIEVKWLGKNENNTPYAQVRIQEGMIQVADYLSRDSRLMQGYLVVYDARSEAKHRDESGYPDGCRHERCKEPIIYFLRSETPSERGVRVTAESRKQAKCLAQYNQ